LTRTSASEILVYPPAAQSLRTGFARETVETLYFYLQLLLFIAKNVAALPFANKFRIFSLKTKYR
jgi:hypothetical protein